MEQTQPRVLSELQHNRVTDVSHSTTQHAASRAPPHLGTRVDGSQALPRMQLAACEKPVVLDAAAASALQYVQQLLPPGSQLPSVALPAAFAPYQAGGNQQPYPDPGVQQAWPYSWQLLQQVQQNRPPPAQYMHPSPPQRPPVEDLQPTWQQQQLLPPALHHIRPRPYSGYPPPPACQVHVPSPPHVHYQPPPPPPPPPPVLDITDISVFPALSSAAETPPCSLSGHRNHRMAASPAASTAPATLAAPAACAVVETARTEILQATYTAVGAPSSNERLTAAVGAPAVTTGVRCYLHTICSRLAHLTPDWPEPLKAAALVALLLEQQQQQQTHGDQMARADRGAVSQHLGKRVPVMFNTLADVASDVSDMKYLQTARRLQEELQAAWVQGTPLPDVGGNVLVSHPHTSSSSTSHLPMMRSSNLQVPSTAAAADDVVVGANGAVVAVAAGDVVQLPQLSSQELMFALFSVWGAAPKITQLISTTAAPAAAGPAALGVTPGAPSAPQVVPLPPNLQSWHVAGGLLSVLQSALQQLTAKQQLSSTAVVPGTQQAVLALQPHTGIDFGTNQVVVVTDSSTQQQKAKQTNDKGDRQQQQQQRGQHENVHELHVDRELVITNTHQSKPVLLLNVCLAPEYREWVTLSHPAGITTDTHQTESHTDSQQEQLHKSSRTLKHKREPAQQTAGSSDESSSSAAPAAVLLPPGGSYTVTARLSTISSRPRSQAELGVISQVCFVTAAVEIAPVVPALAAAAAAEPTAEDLLDLVQQLRHKIISPGNGGTTSVNNGAVPCPAGWHVCTCGVPVAGGLVSQLAALQSVLRAEAKPFISEALRKVFLTPVTAGSGFAFLPAPTDLGWDVPMYKWLHYNGLAFLGPLVQPGLVPSAAVAGITVQRYQAMSSADSTLMGPQAPLLSWGPPVLQRWQRLLLLEEHACERDMASYSVFNIRVATAVFTAAGCQAEQQQQPQQRRRYSISPWPIQQPEDAQMYTYRGPELSSLLGAGRAPRLAVISVPGLPENRPGLITGDVVYLRLASPLAPEATSHITNTLTLALQAAQSASKDTNWRLAKLLKRGHSTAAGEARQVRPGTGRAEALRREAESQAAQAVEKDRLMKLQSEQSVGVAALKQLLQHFHTKMNNLHSPTHIEAAGLVAAVDGSRCLLVMPDSWWLLLQQLRAYDLLQGSTGAWGATAAATNPMLVHASFTLNRTGLGRMQSVLPYVAVNPRLLLPPDLGSGVGGGCWNQQPAAVAAAAAISMELVASGGIASAEKQQEITSLAASLPLCGSVPLNSAQRLAVSSVLSGGGVSAPYVLFGPPGTGKTVTLVEAVLQYRRLHPGARILCCAPANYSADLLCSALAAAGVGVAEMCNLNDPRRPVAQAKQDTLPYCVFNEGLQTFSLSKGLREAARRSIVVCSTTTAGLLLPQPSSTRPSAALPIRAPGAPPPPPATAGAAAASSSKLWQQQMAAMLRSAGGLFDLVVVDESGQGLAPEVLLPLSLANPRAPVLLAGDPRQLGPVLRSATAAAAGLGVSLLDSWIHYWHTVLPQLAATAAEAADKHHQKHLADGTVDGFASVGPIALSYGMLVDNYRSHKRLLDLPSRLFYNGMLRACAPDAAVAPPHWSEIMVKAGEHSHQDHDQTAAAAAAADDGSMSGDDGLAKLCPSSCLFVGVNGQQRQDGDAPSYYNPQEVLVLAELITSLLGTPAAGGAGGGGADVSAGGVRQAAVWVQDIGVIATYRRQVQKIRLLLRDRGLGAIRVGTVDDYQGQEERIIFISTTLTKPESLPPVLPDLSAIQQQEQQATGSSAQQGAIPKFNAGWGSGPPGLRDVGFWRNPKRFNVAITRAKALLVVVGSPRVLVADDNWRQLLQHCVARGAYRGAGSTFLHKMLRVGATPVGTDHSHTSAADTSEVDYDSTSEGLLGVGDDDSNLASAVQAVVEAAQLGVGAADYLFPQTLDEYYAACQEDQPWKVAI